MPPKPDSLFMDLDDIKHEPALSFRFTAGADYVNFAVVTAANFTGDWYNAGAGNDTVFLPTTAHAAQIGFDYSQIPERGLYQDWAFDAGDGDDVIYGSDMTAVVYGGNGNDILYAGTGGGLLFGGNDNDVIYSQQYNALIEGGSGADRIIAGSLTINGMQFSIWGDGPSSAAMNGGTGIDGNDYIVVLGNNLGIIDGGGGDDRILGGNAGNNIFGGAGNDYIVGGIVDDSLNGGDGNDTIYGRGDDDAITGGRGNDLLYGEDGNDYINGNDGNDIIYGGAGNDEIIGGRGTDILYGGEGADVFRYLVGDLGSGIDTIMDFQVGIDRIQLSNLINYNGNLSQYVSFTQNTDGSTRVMVDLDGSGGTSVAAPLANAHVSGGALALSDFVVG
ncbi:MAG: calcium-binding protein [Dongiaceae bacterium]